MRSFQGKQVQGATSQRGINVGKYVEVLEVFVRVRVLELQKA